MKKNKMTVVKWTGSVVLSAVMLLAGRASADDHDSPNVFHFTEVALMDGTGVDTNADGAVGISEKAEGHSAHESLTVAVTGLDTNTTYLLAARIGTNVIDFGMLRTGRHGGAQVEFNDFSRGRGEDGHMQPLPPELEPLSDITEVEVINSNALVVLTADLTATNNRLDYLVNRGLHNGKVRANLLIHATQTHTEFHFLASGLATNAPYYLAFNGDVVQTNTSTARGQLKISSLVETPPFILDVHSVELLSGPTNVVLQTTLP